VVHRHLGALRNLACRILQPHQAEFFSNARLLCS
jgi:hypothetical protein